MNIADTRDMRALTVLTALPFFLLSCGGTVDVGANGGGSENGGDNGANNTPDSGTAVLPDADQIPQQLRGPCTVTVTLDGGSLYEYEYDANGLETSVTYNGNVTETYAWTGLTSVQKSTYDTYTREYIQTSNGLRVKKVVNVDNNGIEMTTLFAVDPQTGDYDSAETVTGSNGFTTKRDFESTDGLLRQELLSNTLARSRYYFSYDGDRRMEGYQWDRSDDGSIDNRLVLVRDSNGRVRESRLEILDANEAVIRANIRAYAYQGECGYVHERWYFRGIPGVSEF